MSQLREIGIAAYASALVHSRIMTYPMARRLAQRKARVWAAEARLKGEDADLAVFRRGLAEARRLFGYEPKGGTRDVHPHPDDR